MSRRLQSHNVPKTAPSESIIVRHLICIHDAVEAEYQELKRKLRMLENDRKAYSDEVTGTIRRLRYRDGFL